MNEVCSFLCLSNVKSNNNAHRCCMLSVPCPDSGIIFCLILADINYFREIFCISLIFLSYGFQLLFMFEQVSCFILKVLPLLSGLHLLPLFCFTTCPPLMLHLWHHLPPYAPDTALQIVVCLSASAVCVFPNCFVILTFSLDAFGLMDLWIFASARVSICLLMDWSFDLWGY